MDFTIEFYETQAGRCPVREFLDELKNSDPATSPWWLPVWPSCGTHSITANRCQRRSATDYSNYVMWVSSIPVCCGFSCRVAGSWRCMASATKVRPFQPATLRWRGNVWAIGGKERHDEKDQF